MYRCVPCHRSGEPSPPLGSASTPPPNATPMQRLNVRCSHYLNTVPEHVAGAGHNEWETLDASSGEWELLGAYVGDGWFSSEWEARPWWLRRTPEAYARARAWESGRAPLPDGLHCLACGWCAPPRGTGGGKPAFHIRTSGHNEWGLVRDGVRFLAGPLIASGPRGAE